MPKTFNKQPLAVNTPSSSNIKDYFFTHANWNGLNNNENVLTVDQETFSDCKNVYVNSNGLLKSRPSLKNTNILVTLDTGESELLDVVDFWEYSGLKIYKTYANDNYYLTFINSKFDTSLQVSTVENIKLVLTEQNIFIFSKTSLNRYDMLEHKYLDAVDFIYIPVHKVKAVGSLKETDDESINELTNIYITRYLFESADELDFGELVGKYISVTVDGNNYQVKFSEGMQVTWVQALTALKDDNFITINGTKYALVSVSQNKSFILTRVIDDMYKIYYTTDGKEFTSLREIYGVVGIPEISEDGKIVGVLCKDDVYYCYTPEHDKGLSSTWLSYFKDYIGSKDYKSYLDKGLYFDETCTLKILSQDVLAATAKIKGYKSECLFSLHNGANGFYINSIYGEELSSDVEQIYDGSSPTGNGVVNVNSAYMIRYLNYSRVYYVEMTITSLRLRAFSVTKDYSLTIEYNIEYKLGTDKVSFNKTFNTTFKGNDQNDFRHTIDLEFVELTYIFDKTKLIVSWHSKGFVNYNKYIPSKGTHNIAINADNNGTYVALDCGHLCYISDTGVDLKNSYNVGVGEQIKRNCRDYPLKIYKNADSVEISHFMLQRPRGDSPNYYLYKYEYRANITDDVQYDDVPYSKFDDFRAVTYSAAYANDYLLTNRYYYSNGTAIPLLFTSIPIYCTKESIYLATNDTLYTNGLNLITIDYLTNKTGQTDIDYNFDKIVNDDYLGHVAEMSNFYFANGKNVYISSKPTEGDFKWYLPSINTTVINEEVTNLHPISDSEMAIFTSNSVYYIKKLEGNYYFNKSKLQVGCKEGSDIITTYDGVYTIFASDRGLVAMQYQNFVATTEQSLTYISDTIHDTFKKFNTDPIKLRKYEYWIYCYKVGSKNLLLLDIRNNSWWCIELPFEVSKITLTDYALSILCDGKVYKQSESENEYYDFDGTNKYNIDWYIQSQKLHLNSLNYSKHISNMTFTTVSDSESSICMNLHVANYKKYMQISKKQSFSFDINVIRTYVKKLNYSKVNEFQYVLSCNKECAIQVPLSLSNIMIKYKISRQVK